MGREGVIQNPAREREELFKIQQEREELFKILQEREKELFKIQQEREKELFKIQHQREREVMEATRGYRIRRGGGPPGIRRRQKRKLKLRGHNENNDAHVKIEENKKTYTSERNKYERKVSHVEQEARTARDAERMVHAAERADVRREEYEKLWASMREVKKKVKQLKLDFEDEEKKCSQEEVLEALVNGMYLLSGTRRTLDAGLYWARSHRDFAYMLANASRKSKRGGRRAPQISPRELGTPTTDASGGGGDTTEEVDVGCVVDILRAIVDVSKQGGEQIPGHILLRLFKSMVWVDCNISQMKKDIRRKKNDASHGNGGHGVMSYNAHGSSHGGGSHGEEDCDILNRISDSAELVMVLCCEQFASGIEVFHPKDLAGMAWALGKMRRNPGLDALNALAEYLTQPYVDVRLHETGDGMATADADTGEGTGAVVVEKEEEQDVVTVFSVLGGVGMSLIVWFFGRILYLPSTKCVAEIQRATSECMAEISGHSLSLIAWGFAMLSIQPDAEWLETAAQHAANDVDWSRTNCYELSNFIWSITSLRFMPTEPVLNALIEGTVRTLAREDRFDTRSISNILWSLTKISLASAEHAGPANVSPRVRNRLWQPSSETMDILAANFARRIAQGEGNTQDIANSLWSFASLEHDPGSQCLDAIRTALEKPTTVRMRPSEALMCMSSLASLDYKPGREAMRMLCGAIIRNLALLHARDLYAILRNLTVLGHDPGASWCRDVYTRIQRFTSDSQERMLTSNEKSNLPAIFDTLGHAASSLASSSSTSSSSSSLSAIPSDTDADVSSSPPPMNMPSPAT